jgi:hypothetical protein
MNQNNLQNEKNRGEKAKLLLEEPLIKEAFALLKNEYQGAIFQTKYNEDETRTALWQAFHITDKVENHLKTVVETGKLATVQLNQLKKNST